MVNITPNFLLTAYASGLFPMAQDATSQELHWFSPDPRTILPLDAGFHTPRSLKKFLRKETFTFTHNQAFGAVIAGCADRPETWINSQIIELFSKLHSQGYAHSVEAWQNTELVGGLYGVALGGAFFAESMFSRVSGASKACLVELVTHLRQQGFVLCDVQYTNAHLLQFGVTEIARTEYLEKLKQGLVLRCRFGSTL